MRCGRREHLLSAARRIAALPGVAHATGLSCGIFKAPGDSEKACGIDPTTLPADVDPGVSTGRLLAVVVPATFVTGLLAAVAPARRAVRIGVLDALRAE